MAVILTAGQFPAMAAPTAVGSGTGGTLAAATYTYRTTYVKDGIETAASGDSNAVVTAGTTSSITITAQTIPGATSYRLYGRTGASFLFIIADPSVTLLDTGANTPTGAAPVDNQNVSFRTPYSGHAQSTGILPGLGANQYQKI